MRKPAALVSTAEYAEELLAETRKNPAFHPYRGAFVAALEARGTDGRTAQFKHYDRIVKWMIANWASELEPFTSPKG